jgi:hypothetical protein
MPPSSFGRKAWTFGGDAIFRAYASGRLGRRFDHSPASKVECAKLIEKLPTYARASAKCIVKIDPNAEKPRS